MSSFTIHYLQGVELSKLFNLKGPELKIARSSSREIYSFLEASQPVAIFPLIARFGSRLWMRKTLTSVRGHALIFMESS